MPSELNTVQDCTSALQPALWALANFAPSSETARIGNYRLSIMDFLGRLLHKCSCNALRWTTEPGFFKLASKVNLAMHNAKLPHFCAGSKAPAAGDWCGRESQDDIQHAAPAG